MRHWRPSVLVQEQRGREGREVEEIVGADGVADSVSVTGWGAGGLVVEMADGVAERAGG